MTKSRTIKLGLLLLIAVLLIAVLGVSITMGVSADTTPMLTWGTVTIEGQQAPAGTPIEIFIGNSSHANGYITTTIPGQYGAVRIWADDSLYGQTLSYKVNGQLAIKNGPDEGLFSLKNQIVNLEVLTSIATWTIPNSGIFPRHLPDTFKGSVTLANLTNVPIDIQGVYYENGTFWANGAPGCTLSHLEGGKVADYIIASTGACEWEIPLN